jgi:hypothetical protein
MLGALELSKKGWTNENVPRLNILPAPAENIESSNSSHQPSFSMFDPNNDTAEVKKSQTMPCKKAASFFNDPKEQDDLRNTPNPITQELSDGSTMKAVNLNKVAVQVAGFLDYEGSTAALQKVAKIVSHIPGSKYIPGLEDDLCKVTLTQNLSSMEACIEESKNPK